MVNEINSAIGCKGEIKISEKECDLQDENGFLTI